MNTLDFLKIHLDRLCESQSPEGSIKAGHNGPYHIKETPIRNSAHFLLFASRFSEMFGSIKYEEAAHKAFNYLKSSKHFIEGRVYAQWEDYTIEDCTNGVIGSAWVIEALVEYYRVFGNEEAIVIARNIFKAHKFDSKSGLYFRQEIKNQRDRIDQTLNHQIWFIAATLKLSSYCEEVRDEALNHAQIFFDLVFKRAIQYNGTVFHHAILPQRDFRSKLGVIKRCIQIVRGLVSGDENASKLEIDKHIYLYWKSIGYHSFLLYGLAAIREHSSNGIIMPSSKIEAAVGYLNSNEFKDLISIEERYSLKYNPPAIERLYINEVFLKEINEQAVDDLSDYLSVYYDFESMTFRKDKVWDVATHNVRLYQLCLLDGSTLDKMKLNIG